MAITHPATVTIYLTDQQKSLDFPVDQLGFDKRADKDMGPMGRPFPGHLHEPVGRIR